MTLPWGRVSLTGSGVTLPRGRVTLIRRGVTRTSGPVTLLSILVTLTEFPVTLTSILASLTSPDASLRSAIASLAPLLAPLRRAVASLTALLASLRRAVVTLAVLAGTPAAGFESLPAAPLARPGVSAPPRPIGVAPASGRAMPASRVTPPAAPPFTQGRPGVPALPAQHCGKSSQITLTVAGFERTNWSKTPSPLVSMAAPAMKSHSAPARPGQR